MLAVLLSGAAMGAVYALVALGFLLIFNACQAANFAQGDLAMLGAYVGYSASGLAHWPIWAAYLAAVAGVGLFGWVFQFVAYRPLQGKPFVSVIVSTLAVGVALRYGSELIWGPLPHSLPTLLPAGTLNLGRAGVDSQDVVIVALTVVLLGLLYLLFEHTRLGLQLRATAQDATAARLMGIPVNRVVAFSFVLSAALTGLAGTLVAPVLLITSDMGVTVGIKAFIAVVIGGMGSIPGAVVGAFFLGIVEQLSAAYVSAAYKDAVAFALLLLILFLRPQGLFGERVAEKV